jgi:protein phosphatase
VLAVDGAVHVDRPHVWHIGTVERMVSPDDPVITVTCTITVDLADESSVAAATEWWTQLTPGGGKGMVVKRMSFVARHRDWLVQLAIKVRGPDYLGIIYGREYTLPENLPRPRDRSLRLKRARAISEFALAIEALQRFVDREGLHRVHECVLGVLAMESEPLDPRW